MSSHSFQTVLWFAIYLCCGALSLILAGTATLWSWILATELFVSFGWHPIVAGVLGTAAGLVAAIACFVGCAYFGMWAINKALSPAQRSAS